MSKETCYGCAGYDWNATCAACTRRSYEFTFTKGNDLDPERGLWVTCFDGDGMEVEVTIKGLNLTRLRAIVAAAELGEKEACSTEATIKLLG